MFNFIRTGLIFILATNLLACAAVEKIREERPLEGPDVTVYPLADGQIEFRLKTTGLTSTLWMTAELVNKSHASLSFNPKELLTFNDPSCLAGNEFEELDAPVLKPGERKLVHYSFQLHAKRKKSPEYERCKNDALRFTIAGILLDASVVKPLTFTVDESVQK